MTTPAPLVKTPAVRIVEELFVGRAYLVELPVDANTVVVEGTSFPPDLKVPEFFPRVYSIVDKERSGSHAHRTGTEDEIMYVVSGLALVHIWDENAEHKIVELTPAGKGKKFEAVFIRSGLWHTVRYFPGTVLNVVASVHYDRDYYIEKPEQYFTPAGLSRYQADFAKLP